jgi:non-ribosomal peptide synthase protein (TIGR01720 family)
VGRTAGWFTSAYPLTVEVGAEGAAGGGAAGEALGWVRRVREAGEGVPGGGAGYGVVKYLSGLGGELREAEREGGRAEVGFNYLGQFDQVFTGAKLFEVAPESGGAERDEREERSHLLEVNGRVLEGRLRLNWVYSENIHAHATIERLADDCMAVLRALIAHSQTDEVSEYQPADFAEFAWGQEEIASIMAAIEAQE